MPAHQDNAADLTYPWIAANAAAYALGWWLLAALQPLPLEIALGALNAIAVITLVAPGLLLGVAQWWFLRRSVLNIGAWWVLVGVGQWVLSLPLATFASGLVLRTALPLDFPYPFFLLWSTAVVFLSLLYAVVAAVAPTAALAIHPRLRRIAVPWMGATTWGLVFGMVAGSAVVASPFVWGGAAPVDSATSWLALALIGACCGAGQAVCAQEYLVNPEHLTDNAADAADGDSAVHHPALDNSPFRDPTFTDLPSSRHPSTQSPPTPTSPSP